MSYEAQQSTQQKTRPSLVVNAISQTNIAALTGVGQVIGGHTVQANDVLYLNNQTTPGSPTAGNGPWTAVAGAWARTPSYESQTNIAGLSVYIQSSSTPSTDNNNIYQVVGAAQKAVLGADSCVATLVSSADALSSVGDFISLTATQALAFRTGTGAYDVPNRYNIASSQTTPTAYTMPTGTATDNGKMIGVKNSSTAVHTITGTIDGAASISIFPGDYLEFAYSQAATGFYTV